MAPLPPPARTLRILPTPTRTAELLRERSRAQGVGLALGLVDLPSFEARLLRACELEPISTTEARLLISSLAPEAARGTVLAELGTQPRFAAAFLQLWDGLRRAGIDGDGLERLARRLAHDSRNAGLSAGRFAALARLAEAYEAALAARGWVDAVGARVRLPQALAELGTQRLRRATDGASRLWVESSPELPWIRAQLWEALAQVGGLEVAVEIPVLPSAIGEVAGELAGALEQLRRNLVDAAPSVELIATSLLDGPGPREFAIAGLIPFVSAAKGRALAEQRLATRESVESVESVESIESIESIDLLDAEDLRAELRGVCARIRALLHRGVAPQAITIAVPRLARARERVLASLTEAEIPIEELAGEPIHVAAPLRLTLALLDAAERGLPREALADLLESAYVDRRDAADLLAGLREAGSRDDRGIGHLGRLRAHAAKLARGPHPDQRRRAARGRRYQALASAWEPVFARLRLATSAPLADHVARLFAALEALGIPERCLALPALGRGLRERQLERDAIAALARDRAALDALERVGRELSAAATAVGVEAMDYSLSEFRAALEAGLSGATERRVGVRGAGVGVCELHELARASSDHLFIVHAVEGELPGAGRSLPLLDDDDRQQLERAAGRPLSLSPLGADAGAFALACAGVRGSLTLSTHRQDREGREVVRSRYFVALARALHRPATELEAAVVPSLAQCSTRTQLLTRLASQARDPDALTLALAAHPQLGPALAWAELRAQDLGRAHVELGPRARSSSHTRLGFDWTGSTTWRGSATSLEDYAACPFRFFAARVLRLRPRPSVRDELDAAEQGSIRHEVLAEVMQALQREGLTPLEGGDRTGEENRVAQTVCAEVLDRWQRYERTGPTALWLLHRDLIERDLGRVLEGERRAAVEAWEPGEFELGFGLARADGQGLEGVPLAIPDRAGQRRFELVGRVDRIDYRGHGREREGLIIDYKSGRVGTRLRSESLARTQLQLPLYAAWLATRRSDLNYADAAYVSLRDGERSQVGLLDLCLSQVELDGLLELDPSRRASLRERAAGAPVGVEPGPPAHAIGALDLPELGPRNLADNVWALLGGVAVGRFDVRPHDPSTACRYCPYGAVCRVERGDEVEGGGAEP